MTPLDLNKLMTALAKCQWQQHNKFSREADKAETFIKKDTTIEEFDKVYPIRSHVNYLLLGAALEGACSTGNIPLIDHIFKKKGKDILQYIHLFKAIKCKNPEDRLLTTKKLIQLGVDPNIEIPYSGSPLSWAVRDVDNLPIVKFLLKHGARDLCPSIPFTKDQHKMIDEAQKSIDEEKAVQTEKRHSFLAVWKLNSESLVHQVSLKLIKKIFKVVDKIYLWS
jgi:hypothetical protein